MLRFFGSAQPETQYVLKRTERTVYNLDGKRVLYLMHFVDHYREKKLSTKHLEFMKDSDLLIPKCFHEDLFKGKEQQEVFSMWFCLIENSI